MCNTCKTTCSCAAENPKVLDLTKPVRTRDGREARIICTDRKAKTGANVVALVKGTDGVECIYYFPPTGRRSPKVTGGLDLVNVPETVYRAIYTDSKNSEIFNLGSAFPFKKISNPERCFYVSGHLVVEDGVPVRYEAVNDGDA